MSDITLRSSAFGDHDTIPAAYSHQAGDTSPPLEWSGVPDGTAELVLTCEDPDAPVGTFVHWLLAGIPAQTSGLGPGERPEGATEGTNDYGFQGYGGPQPPVGDPPHRYFFHVYACQHPLDLQSGYSSDQLRSQLRDNAVASGTLVGHFAR
ncbi:YbhB/YbcL family Raf kinase inhibitor-like protein [Salinactinospora qingdaonensis]|uniref:YbhB/YbcL family Raf kinase inhibitor-like protein n=1 Tax=Salinactinospora qingdaonensis TaxID=702744 RepID=A0ABP7F102_9ACTN